MKLQEHGVDAGQASSSDDFCVGYFVLSLVSEKLSKTGSMEMAELSGVPLVDGPSFTAI